MAWQRTFGAASTVAIVIGFVLAFSCGHPVANAQGVGSESDDSGGAVREPHPFRPNPQYEVLNPGDTDPYVKLSRDLDRLLGQGIRELENRPASGSRQLSMTLPEGLLLSNAVPSPRIPQLTESERVEMWRRALRVRGQTSASEVVSGTVLDPGHREQEELSPRVMPPTVPLDRRSSGGQWIFFVVALGLLVFAIRRTRTLD